MMVRSCLRWVVGAIAVGGCAGGVGRGVDLAIADQEGSYGGPWPQTLPGRSVRICSMGDVAQLRDL